MLLLCGEAKMFLPLPKEYLIFYKKDIVPPVRVNLSL